MRQADEPLTKVTLNLYTRDYDYIKESCENPTIQIRNIIHWWIKKRKESRDE